MNKGPFVLRSWGRRLFWGRPTLYRHLGLVRGRGDCFDQDFDLWIGGFPRSANTFAAEAFRLANPGVRLMAHRHLPPFIVRWVDAGRPGVFLIRKPEDAVISWAIVWGGYLEESLDYYLDFHRALLPYVSRLFVAPFDLVTRDFGAVLEAFNQCFGTPYVALPPGAPGENQVFAQIEKASPLSGNELTICRPSEKRAQLQSEFRRQLRETPVLIRKLEQANALYATFTAAPLGRKLPRTAAGAAPTSAPAQPPTRRATPAASGPREPAAVPSADYAFSLTGRSAVQTMETADSRAMINYVAFRLKRFLLPVVFVGMALLVRLALEPTLHGGFPYSFFYIAIILTAWTCGTSETFLAVLLGFLAAEWFVIAPVRSLAIVGTPGWVGAATYFFVGLAIVWFIKSKQSARLLALSSAVEARRHLEEVEHQQTRAEQMQQQLERLTAIVDGAHLPLLSFSPEGLIETWNRAAEGLFGYTATEAIGQPLALLVPADNRRLQQDLVCGITGDGTSEPWEAALARKDGSVVTVWLTLSPLKSRSGKSLGAAVVARRSAP